MLTPFSALFKSILQKQKGQKKLASFREPRALPLPFENKGGKKDGSLLSTIRKRKNPCI
jgi:hypothetical protein